jgi:hypothetical protein
MKFICPLMSLISGSQLFKYEIYTFYEMNEWQKLHCSGAGAYFSHLIDHNSPVVSFSHNDF